MLAATLIGVFFTPLFYWLVMSAFTRRGKAAAAGVPPVAHAGEGSPAATPAQGAAS
jgi:hypothetical protein